jgi:hypothetical protein
MHNGLMQNALLKAISVIDNINLVDSKAKVVEILNFED